MTKEIYLDAKRAACLRYIEKAERDALSAKTPAALNNANCRKANAERQLAKINSGHYWNAGTEYLFRTCYEPFPDSEAESVVSAV